MESASTSLNLEQQTPRQTQHITFCSLMVVKNSEPEIESQDLMDVGRDWLAVTSRQLRTLTTCPEADIPGNSAIHITVMDVKEVSDFLQEQLD